jgi:uncharacterized protein with NRDE domain
MCLVVLAYKVHAKYPLIVAANRDEFLERPAKPLHFWDDAPHILAGRDERAGGTWMGLSTAGRFAALTNYRDLKRPEVHGPSRGALVHHVLDHDLGDLDTSRYAGFNLLHGTIDALRYHSNVNGANMLLEPGIHGLSNHLLNTPWPKVQRAKAGLAQVVRSEDPNVEAFFDLLGDGTPAPDHTLPDTGIGPVWERALSSIMIQTEGYGTRCSSVILVDAMGKARFVERTYPSNSEQDRWMRTKTMEDRS